MPPRVMHPRGRGIPLRGGLTWGRNAPRSRGVGVENVMPLPTEGQVGEQLMGDNVSAGLSADNWEENVQDDVQDDAQNEVNQGVPPVPTAPPVSAETELFLKHMATAMAGAFQAQQQQQ